MHPTDPRNAAKRGDFTIRWQHRNVGIGVIGSGRSVVHVTPAHMPDGQTRMIVSGAERGKLCDAAIDLAAEAPGIHTPYAFVPFNCCLTIRGRVEGSAQLRRIPREHTSRNYILLSQLPLSWIATLGQYTQ